MHFLVVLILVSLAALEQPAVPLTEFNLRKSAVTLTRPDYPAASRAAKSTGVAVAVIRIKQVGQMSPPISVNVIQSPDAAIAASVQSALSQWRFDISRVIPAPGNYYQGRIVLYFRRLDDKWVVNFSDEF